MMLRVLPEQDQFSVVVNECFPEFGNNVNTIFYIRAVNYMFMRYKIDPEKFDVHGM